MRLTDAFEAAESAESAVKPSIRRLCEWRGFANVTGELEGDSGGTERVHE